MTSKSNTKNTGEKKSKTTTKNVTEQQPVVEKASTKTSSKSQKAGSTKSTPKEAEVKVVAEKVVTEKVVAENKTGGSKPKKSKAQPKPQEEVVVAVVAADEENTKSGLRYFKLDYENEVGGRYSGKKPKQAANKAYSSIIRKKGMVGGGQKIQFSIKECTRGSKQKTYTYDGERIELDEPVQVIIKGADGNKPIEYKFSNKLSKAKQAVSE
jgi:hypothetical protein